MIEPHVHIACAPKGDRVSCAAFWIVQNHDIYGWFTGARKDGIAASFFALENYYATRDTVFYRSSHNDVHGAWLIASAQGEAPIDGPEPLPEAMRHELERLQDAFVHEWLSYADDAGQRNKPAATAVRGAPANALTLRPKKRGKLHAGTYADTYSSVGADLNVIDFLSARWPLDYTLSC